MIHTCLMSYNTFILNNPWYWLYFDGCKENGNTFHLPKWVTKKREKSVENKKTGEMFQKNRKNYKMTLRENEKYKIKQ